MPQLFVRVNGEVEHHAVKVSKFTIGKREDNNLVLEVPGISRQHCVIFHHTDKFYLRDLKSANGTFLNGNKIEKDAVLTHGDQIRVGEAMIIYRADSMARPKVQQEEEKKEEEPEEKKPLAPWHKKDSAEIDDEEARLLEALSVDAPDAPDAGGEPDREIPLEVKRVIHHKLLDDRRLRHMDFSSISEEEAAERTREVIVQIIEKNRSKIPRWIAEERLIQEVLDEALGLGPLEDLLKDPTVNEIMVNRSDQIFIEKAGRGVILSEKKFLDDDQVVQVIQRIIAPIGRRINESTPLCDARLKDGSRVNAIIKPLAVSGPTLTIRKFPEHRLSIEDLIKYRSVTRKVAAFLDTAVAQHKNIVISGGTGSGKTTLLNIVSNFISEGERIVTVEDVAELRLNQTHVVTLETRPANLEGEGEISIQDLVKNCLRMRPDRIIVGECRSGEALDMLQAMNTGHDGSLTTLHANSPQDAMSRLEALVLMSGIELPVSAIRRMIVSAVNLVVQQSRLSDGSRKVMAVTEVVGLDEGEIVLQDIFKFNQTGLSPEGKIEGALEPTGNIPNFIHEMKKRGIEVDMTVFGT